MTNSRQSGYEIKRARGRRRWIVAVVGASVCAVALLLSQSVVDSLAQARAALRGVSATTAPRADSSAPPPIPPAPSTERAAPQALPSDAQRTSQQPLDPLDDVASVQPGPPSGADVMELIERGLVPDADAEEVEALRAVVESDGTAP